MYDEMTRCSPDVLSNTPAHADVLRSASLDFALQYHLTHCTAFRLQYNQYLALFAILAKLVSAILSFKFC